ncbi:hypothetical protein [Streptomyces sp. NPDC047525]|uniref:hypothetical protein n=1 Tax=Streptomyces sp. NPDC047525 TaxID=3155264 RepID=UPI0033DB2CBB
MLIIDNADDPNNLEARGRLPGDGNGWLRSTKRGLIIVTSRCDAALWGPICHVRKISELSPMDGGKLLLDLAPEAGSYESAQQISTHLGGLPLALNHAGRYLSSSFAAEDSFDSYLRGLSTGMGDLLRSHSRPVLNQGESVWQTWDLSVGVLVDCGVGDARNAMLTLSLGSAPNPIPLEIFRAAVHRQAVPRSFLSLTLPSLSTFGLIEIQNLNEGFESRFTAQVSVHPVVAEMIIFAASADSILESKRNLVTCFESAVAALDRLDPRTWRTWVSLVPHLSKLLESSLEADERFVSDLLHVVARVISALAFASEHPKAEDLAKKVEDYALQFPSCEITGITARYCIAQALRTRSDSRAGEREFRDILSAQVPILGPFHADVFHTRHNLAHTLAAKGLVDESIREFRVVIAGRETTLGAHDQYTIISNMALLFWIIKARRPLEANAQYNITMLAVQEVYPAGHPIFLTLRQRSAEIKILEGQVEGLTEELHEIIERQQELLGVGHISILGTCASLADVLEMEGQNFRSLAILDGALSALQLRLGHDHPKVVNLQARLNGLRRQSRNT